MNITENGCKRSVSAEDAIELGDQVVDNGPFDM